MDVKSIVVEVDVCEQLTIKHEFVEHEHLLKWIRTKASILGLCVVTWRYDNGFDKRHTFVTMRSKRGGKY